MNGRKVLSLVEKVVDEVGVRREGMSEDGIEDLQGHANHLLQQ